MEAMCSEFDYFTPVPVQASIVDEYDESIAPSSTITPGSTIEYTIKGEPNIYRDLSNSYIAVQCKVTTSDGAKLASDAAVAPANLLLHSMFSGVDIEVCGVRITDKDVLYPYRAFIETLLTYSDEVLESRTKLAGWLLDKDANAMDRVILATSGSTTPNPAFVERNRSIAESRSITLVGRLHADLFHQNLDIPPNCPINIRLTPSESGFVLMAARDATFKLVIESARLYVRSKQVVPDLIMAHRNMLDRSNFRFPHTAVGVRKFQVPSGLSKHEIADIFKTKLPKRIVVGMASHSRVSGAYNLNPFKFEHFNLNEISLTVGGQQIPREPIATNYTTGNYGRAYLNTLGALGLDIGNRAIALTPELWASAYNLYAFKLVPGPIDNGPSHSMRDTAAVNLKLNFASDLSAPIDVIVYSETDALLEITKLNSAILS